MAPLVENVSVQRVQFGPSDRVLVRVLSKINGKQRRSIQNAVRQWCGLPEDKVFVYSALDMEVAIERR